MLPLAHSHLTPRAIAEIARPLVGPVHAARLERAFGNHVYRLETSEGIVYAKLARRGWRSLDDARWEQQLLRHLSVEGVAVPEPVGPVLGVFCGEGERPLSIVRELPGRKPTMSVETYRTLGETLARLHEATRSFAPTVPGRLLGASHLVRRPHEKALPTLRSRGFATDRLGVIADACAQALDRLTPEVPFGVVHGDVSLDNIHIDTRGEIAFFDFDLGGHGWFAYDMAHFQAWANDDPGLAGPFWAAIQEGYATVRSLTPAELDVIPWFHLAYWIWDLEHVLHNYVDWFGFAQADDTTIGRAIEGIERLSGTLGI